MKKIILFTHILFAFHFTFAQMSGAMPAGHPNVDQTNTQQSSTQEMQSQEPVTAEKAQQKLINMANNINVDEIQRVAMNQNGRIKPLDTLAKEHMMYISGSYGRWGLNSVQIYLAMIVEPTSPFAELIEVRDVELRQKLGYLKEKRFFSLAEIESSPLMDLANPLFKKQQNNAKSLSESEKKVLETFQQFSLLKSMQSGENFLTSIDFSFLNAHGNDANQAMTGNKEIQELARTYLTYLSQNKSVEANQMAPALVKASRAQKTPELFQHYLEKLDLEIFYNKARLFLVACVLCLILGSLLLIEPVQKKIPQKLMIAFFALPIIFQTWALGIRVYITRFAPITNMYGTMIWVSLGVILFSLLLYVLYRNRFVSGLMLIGSGLILLLTERTPLVLSPDLDPIVAVLRSNYWLSTHVTTITISYAAFTIAMILGNVALIRVWTHKDNTAFFKEYSHYAYRMIQLGVFLLTVGIILGGIWADYSWGRFWGWDPKETWALIADLGFLAILHARYTGWVKEFSLLAWCPVAYLLVIMAWYGVNFILAAGLHSYGFSSGGAAMVATFVSIQLGLLLASWLKLKSQKILSSN